MILDLTEETVFGLWFNWTSNESGPADVGDPTPPESRTTTVYGSGAIVVYGPNSVTFDT